jgi:Ca-activated chloride channel family protein
MSEPKVIISPATPGYSVDGQTLDILIRLQAPAAPEGGEARRPPMHLALVIDRSGSMSGGPLREALKCAEHIVRRMRPADRVAVVAYDDEILVPAPLAAVVNPDAIVASFAHLPAGGSTALHAGWQRGVAELKPLAAAGQLSRVVLLSDGEANQGLTDPEALAAEAKQETAAHVTTTTIGLGHNFNEVLMAAMADAGQGRHYYGQTAADLQSAFEEEFALLEALHAREITLAFVPGPGVLLELRSADGRADAPVALADLAYGAETWLFGRLHIAARRDSASPLFSVAAHGTLRDGSTFATAPAMLVVPALSAADAQRLPRDEIVLQRGVEVEAGRLFRQARAALAAGNRKAAREALTQVEALAAANPWVAEALLRLKRLIEHDEAMFMKESLHAHDRMSRRLSASDEAAYLGPVSESAKPAYLRRKPEQGKGS